MASQMVIWYTLLNQIKHKQKISKSSGSQICPELQAKRSRQTETRRHTLPRLWRNLNWRQHQMWWLLLLGKQRSDPILTLRSEWKKLVVPNDRKPCKFKQDEAVTSPNHSRENRTSSIKINWKKSSDCASSSLCIASRWVWFHSANSIVKTIFDHEKTLREQAKRMNVTSLRPNPDNNAGNG